MRGADVTVFDYRGYGFSTGKPDVMDFRPKFKTRAAQSARRRSQTKRVSLNSLKILASDQLVVVFVSHTSYMHPSDLKSIKRFLEGIIDGIRSLREGIQKISNTEVDQRIAEQKSQQNEREIIRDAIDNLIHQKSQSDDSAETNQDRRHRQNLKVQWTAAIATSLAFIAAAIYGCEAHLQLKEMRNATNATQQAAYAACVGAQIARGALIQSAQADQDAHDSSVATTYQTIVTTQAEEAYVIPSVGGVTLAPGQPISVESTIKNVGKSLAKNVKVKTRSVLVLRDEDPKFIYPVKLSSFLEVPQLEAGVEPHTLLASPNVPVKKDDGTLRIAEPNDLMDIGEGRKDILFFSRITYDDSLGVHHWINFCRKLQAIPLNGITAPEHTKCVRYNKSDNNAVVSKPHFVAPQTPSIPEINCPVPAS